MGQQEKVPGGNGPTGDSVLKITGDEKNNKRCYQPLAISGKKGDCFMACGWGYADSVSLKEKFFESDPHAGNSLNSRKNRHFGSISTSYPVIPMTGTTSTMRNSGQTAVSGSS